MDLLKRFFRLESSSTEAYEVQKWINSQKGSNEFLESFDTFDCDGDSEVAPSAEMKHNIHERIKLETLTQQLIQDHKEVILKVSRNRSSKILSYLPLIASVILLVIISIATTYYFTVWYQHAQVVETPNLITKTTEAGQKLTILLSDGSKAILNTNSSITYPQIFSGKTRKVQMTGEVYFDVTADATKPFMVSTSQLETTVLGTSFNIKELESGYQEVSLLTGKIRVVSHKTSAINFLEPGEELLYDGQQLIKTTFNTNTKVLWKDGIINFEETPLNECFKILEDWYGVEIEVENGQEMGQRKMSGRFDNDYLSNVLNSIAYTENIDYEIDQKTVKIKFKE